MTNTPFTRMVTAVTSDFTTQPLPQSPPPVIPQSQLTAIVQVPLPDVPAGQQLVLQHITFNGAVQANIAVLAHLTTSSATPGSSPASNHQLVLTQVTSSPGNVQWMCSQPVTFYPDAAGVSLTIGVTPTVDHLQVGTVSVSVTVSGLVTSL